MKMMPVYRYMDSYPHQRSQTGYQPFPTYTPMDPPKSPMVYESWPNGGSYGYPMPSHSCCNHGHFPGFHGFRPSYPQPMPSPVHFCGGYPASYPDADPVYYMPPPHYSAELPRYEFDKNMPGRHHCCGCPNHPLHQKGDSSLKIEEQEPDSVEKKGNDSVVPVQTNNHPYPVVWIPQEYAKEQRRPFEPEVEGQVPVLRKNNPYPVVWIPHEYAKEQKRPFEPEVEEQETDRVEREDSRDQGPKVWKGWFPVDADKIKYLMNGGDGKRTRNQESEEQKDFQFPVIWMPSYEGTREEGGKKESKDRNGGQDQKSGDQMSKFPFPIFWLPPQEQKRQEEGEGKDGKEFNTSSNVAENPPYAFKFVPMRHLDGANNMENSQVSEKDPASKNDTEAKEKTSTRKDIPVKHVDPREEEKLEDTKEKVRVVPVKQVEETISGKPAGANGERQSPSSPKSSKLPPVCLRVEPLSKKKNGSPRFPSPPGVKNGSQQNSGEAVKAPVQSKENSKHVSVKTTPSDNRELETENRGGKETLVTDKTSDEPQVSAHLVIHTDAEASEKPTKEETAETKEDTELAKPANERKLEKKTLSEVEAAVRIQSAYRGFETRRSEPLKKLKQIAEVHKQVVDVQNRIQALELSSDIQKDDKLKLLIGETIMRLLLKLDTIQGLHSSLRDIRKSLAKELVTLQEKLDTLVSEQPKVNECPVEPELKECILSQEKQEEVGGNGSSNIMQSVGDKLLPAIDSEDKSKLETLLSSSDDMVQQMESEGDDQELLEATDIKPKEPDSEAIVEHKDEVREGMPGTCAVDLEMGVANDTPELKQAGEVPVKEDGMDSDMLANSSEATDGTLADDNLESTLNELPVNVIDDGHVEAEEDKQVEMDDNLEMILNELPVNVINDEQVESEEDKQAEMEDTTAYGAGSAEATVAGDDEGLIATQEDANMNELAELPIGAIREDSTSSVEVEKNDDLQESKCQSTTETTLPVDNTSNEVEKTEEVLEEKPTAEAVACGRGEYEEEQKLPVTSVPEVGTGQMQDKEVEKNNRRSFSSESEELQSVIPVADDEQSGKVLSEDEKHLPVVTAEEVKENQEMEVQATNQSEPVCTKKLNDNSEGLKAANEEALAGSELPPLHLQAGHEGESVVTSPTCSQMSANKWETKIDKQLMEENEKLREMMEKLMEAGKQQLNVISNLKVRVKDLEKKLSRRKRPRTTKQNRSSACGVSRLRRSNAPVKEGPVSVAM